MRSSSRSRCALSVVFVLMLASVTHASLTFTTGVGTTHAGNLVTNGSFETGALPTGNRYCFTGTGNVPFAPPPAWTTSGTPVNAGAWGNDGGSPRRLKSSDVLPDGDAGIYFGDGRAFFSNNPTSISALGEIAFPSGTTVNSNAGGAALIGQSVPTDVTVAPSYKMSFWVSGEENATVQGNNTLSVMALRMTNVLAGNPFLFIVVPNGVQFGQSHLYELTFSPLVPTTPVGIQFISWGKADFSAAGGPTFGTEAVIDDVIINAVPEPASIGSIVACAVAMLLKRRRRTCAVAIAVVASTASISSAALTLTTGLGTTHTGNLVTNGSFENGAPPDGPANWTYWATGSTQGPVTVPGGWNSSGASQTYAFWGNDGPTPYHTNFSAQLPDGRAGMYFGNGAPVFVSQPPTFNPNGTVSFPAAPTFTANYTNNVAVNLNQLIPTDTNVAPSYKFSFWASGEDAGGFSAPFGGRGIFGLRVTNTLAGDPIQWLTVPVSTTDSFGSSHLYEYSFTPLNPFLPVKIEFINWGHFDLSAYGGTSFTTELVIDDVIINPVPEPAAAALMVTLAVAGSLRRRRT